MVKITLDDVYESTSYNWQSGREIRNKLKIHLGINNLNLVQKINFLFHLQYWDISLAEFYSKLSSLEDKGLVEKRGVSYLRENIEVTEYQYRRLITGKRILNYDELEGLELVFSPV